MGAYTEAHGRHRAAHYKLDSSCSRPLQVCTIATMLAFAQRRFSSTVRARTYASVSASSPNPNTVGPFQVFDRSAKRTQKDRAAARDGGARSRTVDYVRDEIADRMIERFQVCSRLPRRAAGLEQQNAGHKTQVRYGPRLGVRSGALLQAVRFGNYTEGNSS